MDLDGVPFLKEIAFYSHEESGNLTKLHLFSRTVYAFSS